MIYKSAGLSVGNTLLNGLPNIDLVRQVVPASVSGQLFNETRCVRANIEFIGHRGISPENPSSASREEPA
jgi:hypothetical protein